MTEQAKESARMALEDAVLRCLEAGMSEDEVVDEVAYAIKNADA
jgi:hypothetical protein